MGREQLITWLNGQTWSEKYQLADWHLAEIEKAKKTGFDGGWDECQKLMKEMGRDSIAKARADVAREIMDYFEDKWEWSEEHYKAMEYESLEDKCQEIIEEILND